MRNILLILIVLISCIRTFAQEINLAFIKSISPDTSLKFDALSYNVLESFVSTDTSLKFLKENFDKIKNPFPESIKINDSTYIDTTLNKGDTIRISFDDPFGIHTSNFYIKDINNDKLNDIIFKEISIPCEFNYIFLNKNGHFKCIFNEGDWVSCGWLSNIKISDAETDIYISESDYMISEYSNTDLYVLNKNMDSLEFKWSMIFPHDLILCKEQNVSENIIVVSDSSILRKQPIFNDSIRLENGDVSSRNKIVSYRKNAKGISLSEIKNDDGQAWCFVVMLLSSKPTSYFYKLWGTYGEKQEPLSYPNPSKTYFIGWMNKNDIKYIK